MAVLLKKAKRQFLVYFIIFDNKNAKPSSTHRQGAGGFRSLRGDWLDAPGEDRSNSISQFPPIDRFRQVGRDAQFPATDRISAASDGAQHHNGNVGNARSMPDPVAELESVYFGHTYVEQDQLKRCVCTS